MNLVRLIAAFALGFTVSACGSTENVSRSQLPEQPFVQPVPSALDVQSVTVRVPQELKVSEANSYYPGGDIVWREDAPGDRHAQVQTIVQTAMEKGVSEMSTGGVPVALDVQVTRFHALTEKARYTVGGVHALQFMFRLVDPVTGVQLTEPKMVKADFKAYGGRTAIAAEQQGLTQKVRITEHLAYVIQMELQSTEGYAEQKTGLIGALNQL